MAPPSSPTRLWPWHAGLAVSLLLSWEAFARGATTLLLPTPSETAAALLRLLTGHALWQALATSHEALLLGFAAAVAAGVPTGLALGRWSRIARWLDPQLEALMVTPMSALIPLIILAAGLSTWTRGFVVFAFSVPVVVVTTEAGMRDTNPTLVEMARGFGASPWQVLYRVQLPAARPAILTGIRLALGRAFSGMVVSELVLMAAGIGGLLLEFQADFDAASVYALAAVVVAEAVVLMRTAHRIERRLAVWRRPGVAA